MTRCKDPFRSVSPECESAFWEGIDKDREMKKYHGRLIRAVYERGIKATLEAIILSGKIQSGLEWAARNGLLHRSLEQIILNFPKDFPRRELREAANWRLGFIEGRSEPIHRPQAA